MPFLDSALELVGAVVIAGGGLALLVYQAFKHLAAKWLDTKFDERLQDLRHKHERELEHLRFRINALLDRTTKLNEREFDVLPKAWSKLHTAFWQARAFVSSLQSYPDLDRMQDSQLDDFIENCQLASWQKPELRASTDKNGYYQKHIYWVKLATVLDQVRDANIFLAKVGIFMLPDVRERFGELATMVFDAVSQDRFNHEHEIRPMPRDKIDRFVKDGEPKLLELERIVHTRLWPAERGAT
jgi:hypothetical protein